MTVPEFPGHDGATLVFANALTHASLASDAALFAERLDPQRKDPYAQAEIALRLLRAKRGGEAHDRLRGVPDDLHPLVRPMRAVAVVLRDRQPGALAAVLADPGPGGPAGLRLVALAASAVGDRPTAEHAAVRYLAEVNGADPELRELMAPAQAVAGDRRGAVESTEHAVAGSPGDPEAPVRRILADLAARGRPELGVILLKAAYLATKRELYGRLLVAAVPRRVRLLYRYVLLGMAAMASGLGLSLTRLPALIVVGIALLLTGVVLSIVAISSRPKGVGWLDSREVQDALQRYRAQSGTAEVVVVPITVGAVGFGITAGRMAGGLTSASGTVASALVVVGLALATAVVLVALRRRRRRINRKDDTVAPDRCRCWQSELLPGPVWSRYIGEHLQLVALDAPTGAHLRRCPTTERMWLSMPTRAVAVRVQIPEPEPGYAPTTGAYL